MKKRTKETQVPLAGSKSRYEELYTQKLRPALKESLGILILCKFPVSKKLSLT